MLTCREDSRELPRLGLGPGAREEACGAWELTGADTGTAWGLGVPHAEADGGTEGVSKREGTPGPMPFKLPWALGACTCAPTL